MVVQVKEVKMLMRFVFFAIALLWTLFIPPTLSARQLTINVIGGSNGVGLDADKLIMKRELEALGYIVNTLQLKAEEEPQKADINIFFQNVGPKYFHHATLNWFVPNPECCRVEDEILNQFDLILCRTKEVERIFLKKKMKTYFLGFTSVDCYLKNVKKNFSKFFHLGGRSKAKSTGIVFDLWKANGSLGFLTIVRDKPAPIGAASLHHLKWIGKHIPKHELTILQNSAGIHLCPSEAEGYGHYLMEGMSTGAVIITTNAPPMNEFITDERCLVPYTRQAPQALGTNYYITQEDLEKVVLNLMQLSFSELAKIGRTNRQNYLTRTEQFRRRLEKLLNATNLPE